MTSSALALKRHTTATGIVASDPETDDAVYANLVRFR